MSVYNILKNRPYVWAVFLCLAMFVAGCSKTPLNLEYYSAAQETPQSFSVCHSYGCRQKTLVELSDQEWALIMAPLKETTKVPAQERAQIVKSIALIEHITGEKIGTDQDVGGATIRGHGFYQLDCIDEAVNTSKYLRFFAEENLLSLHDVSMPARRGTFIDGAWPHNTAVVVEKETGQRYAIDSWFFDNGQEPSIVPLEAWLDGWRP